MALANCPACGMEVPIYAKFCPHCGAAGVQSVAAPTPDKRKWPVLIILACVLGPFLLFIAVVGNPPTPVAETKDDAYTACYMAHEFVKARLKAPATADFSPCLNADGTTAVTKYTDGSWGADGYVDSQNSFGANLRSTYNVRLHWIGGDNWHADSVELSPS
jgi:hypothetical protein